MSTTAVRAPCDEGVIRAGDAPARGVSAAAGPRAGTWVLVAAMLGSSMAFIDGTVVNVALPVLQRALRADVAGVQWVVEAYALLLSALLLVGGSLGDRYGRKRVFAIGVGVFGLASVACGLAPSLAWLVAARAVQGVGGALLVPGSLALISASFTPEQRGRAIGTWSGGTAIAAGLGPVLGGWLVQSASWRWIFFVNVPMAAAVLAILLRVPESRDDEAAHAPLDVAGAVLTTLGLGGVTLGLVESAHRGWTSPLVLGGIAGGAAALAGFVAVEHRSRAPMVPPGLFRSRTFTGANLLTLLLYAALGGAMFFIPFDLIDVQGYGPAAAGAAFLPFIVLMSVLSRWSGGLVDRFGARLPLTVGPMVAAAGFALFALPGIGGSYWTTFFPAVVVLGAGMSIAVAPLTTAVMGAVESRHAGVASGINNAVSRAAGLLSIAAFGLVAIGAFGGALPDRLAANRVPADVGRAVEAQHVRLAAAAAPPGAPPAVRAAADRAVDEAFVHAFRVVMLVAAAMAAASGIIGWMMIDPTPALRATASSPTS
ncbi:MFS transporter [Longimicrobium sp.]|uniref:MFS transporter n=1 Tax=Longimicrobium sp. TaxID=2029185 RepID=UPI002CE43E5B|nr:MFS transporter [Longimicrobium sp.]HSU14013.1 MFS transporter [Longimicrobium sp.]